MIFENKKLELELNELYKVKNYDGVIAKINSSFGEKSIPAKFEKQLALAYYYKADYENSLTHFKHLTVKDECTENLFNVLMSLLALKKSDEARDVFNKIIATHRGPKSTGQGQNFLPQLCIPFVRYYYACGLAEADKYDEASIQLEELKKIYISLKVTDSTYLYLRGIPFFSDTLELAKKIFAGQNKDFKNSAFLNDLLSAVDSEGRSLIKNNYLN